MKNSKKKMYRGKVLGKKKSKEPIFFSVPGISEIDQKMEHSRSQMIDYGYSGYEVEGIGKSLLQQMENSRIKYLPRSSPSDSRTNTGSSYTNSNTLSGTGTGSRREIGSKTGS
jgi:hypothetical protein